MLHGAPQIVHGATSPEFLNVPEDTSLFDVCPGVVLAHDLPAFPQTYTGHIQPVIINYNKIPFFRS